LTVFSFLFSSKTESSGQYCFDVVPGDYVVSVGEVRDATVLSPVQRRVSISDFPIVGIDFSQLIVSVSGRVQCITKPCTSPPNIQLKPKNTNAVTQTVMADVKGKHCVIMWGGVGG
jgi:hypothetical protein